MFYLKSKLINTYDVKEFTDKDTGQITPASTKLQFFVENPLRQGGVQIVPIDVKCHNGNDFKPFIGQVIMCPVKQSIYNNKLFYEVPFGCKPEVSKAA